MPPRNNKKQENGFGLDILWPPPDKSDLESDVDIVFIHGLNGKRHNTWTKGDVLWPRDLLAKDFPRARVMTWGYDSRVMQFFGPVGQGSIHDHANELNNDISQERSRPDQIFRPIIFFAHSLGELVVKSALFRSYMEGLSDSPTKDRCAAVLRSTAGVIFAGTPHRGSDQARWASMATALAKAAHKDHSSRMSGALARGSEVLDYLQEGFKKIQHNFHIFTFVEELPVYEIGHIVEADSAVINCDSEKRRMIHANHMEMVRFDHENYNEYKKIRDAFQQIHDHLSANGMPGTRDRPIRLDGHRGSYTRLPESSQPRHSTEVLEESWPRLSIQQGVSTFQQQMNDLGRVNTVRSEEHMALSPRQRSHRSSGASLPRPSSERLTARTSTTTLGTVSSGTSRHSSSQLVPRVTEEELVSDPNQAQYLSLLAQGKTLSRQRDRSFATNLTTASHCFHQALSLLPADADRTAFASIHYQLLGVEFEMAYHRDMIPHEKLSHLRSAEQHGWDASYNARQYTNGGLLAQVQLYMAVIKGRSAEVNERLGVSAQDIRRQKDDALSEIAIAVEKIRELRPAKLQESVDFADTWTKRLSPPPNPPSPNPSTITASSSAAAGRSTSGIPAPYTITAPHIEASPPPYSPMAGVYTAPPPPPPPPPAAELDTAPHYSHNNSIRPPFAELDTSGQLTTARYLQPEHPFGVYSPGGR